MAAVTICSDFGAQKINQPTPQAPRARTHARPPGHWGVLEAHRAPGPGQAVAGLVLVPPSSRTVHGQPCLYDPPHTVNLENVGHAI